MQITQLLAPSGIALGCRADDKQAAIHEMVGLLSRAGGLTDPALYEADVLARESQVPTDVGGGIAIPHAKSAGVSAPGLAAMTLAEPVAGANGEPLRLLFLIAAPEGADEQHIQVLSRLAMLLMDPTFADKLLAASSPEAFLRVIAEQEEREEARAAARKAPLQHTTYKLLAVTGCPTGIAHTYMAAEALREAAKQRGVSIKVETNGASGIDGVLRPDEIAAASCIIVAADRAVEMDRFAGKPLLRVPVTAAVRAPEELIEEALSGTVPRWTAQTAEPSGLAAAEEETRTWLGLHLHNAYTHLMNGVSHMLPFVTGSGILIALSYLLNSAFNIDHNFTWMLKSVGETGFAMMYPILAGFIALSLGGEPAFVPGIVGGYLAQCGMTVQPELYWVSSGFWGTLAAGFAAGFLMRVLMHLGGRLPKGLDQAKTTLLYPTISLLAIGALMVFVINPPMGAFNDWLYRGLNEMSGGSRLLLCAVLGGLMATDYGGPINKAAYLFGTIALMNDQYDIMASVMIGGMVPPVGVALCCLLFPDRFTEAERRTTPQNFLLGASFVTEGALPFVLKDPLRVMPSCMLGSAAAGVLSAWFGCGCPAPHGGLFLLPVMDEPLLYLAALAVGSLITALMMGLLKKPQTEASSTEVPGK